MILIHHSLSSESVFDFGPGCDGAEAIGQLARPWQHPPGVEPEMIERAVLEREASRTTAFANGAAIPHCRLPGLDALRRH
jgi:mannitol/fructose-specific phosphotransferase system IIA component